jgi:aminoglycoside N3'-acetyltransferase
LATCATSPYARLAELDGFCLVLGARFNCNSVFHVAEEIVRPTYLEYYVLSNVRVTDQKGRSFVHTFRRYDCSDRGIRRYLGKMEPTYREHGLLRESTIGAYHTILLRARDNVDAIVSLLRANPEFILAP